MLTATVQLPRCRVWRNFPALEFRALLLAAGVAAGIARGLGAAEAPGSMPVWPPAPAEPRITYVREICKPADIGVKPGTFGRIGRWITGETRAKDQLDKPFGLSLDAEGDLLVTDMGDCSVSLLEFRAKRWTRWKGAGKIAFKSPVAAVRSQRTVFVADSALGKVFALGGKGKLQFELTRELERPAGLALLDDQLLVADSQRHRVVRFDTRGQYLSQFGQRGAKPGEFNFPSHITVDGSRQIYVTDALNNRIQVFDAAGQFRRAFGGTGVTSGNFNRPKGVAVDRAGRAYVVDAAFENVQLFDDTGRLLMNWGEAGAGLGQFWLPNAIVVASDQQIYVADSYNHRLQVFRYLGKS